MCHKLKILCYAYVKMCRLQPVFQNKEGVTLVEVIITIAVTGAVIVPLMTLFVMCAKINRESDKEYKSMLTAQKYMEEIKAMQSMDEIENENYIYDQGTGSYERTVIQTDDEYGAEITIMPVRSFLYSIEVLVTYRGEVINYLTGSKILHDDGGEFVEKEGNE